MPKIIKNPRENILYIGKNILLEKNYSQLNIREIAKLSGIGVGTFYNYFSNKRELAIAIFENDWNKVIKRLMEIQKNEMPLKEKLKILNGLFEHFANDFLNVFQDMNRESKTNCPHDNKHFDILYSEFNKLIDFERSRGCISSNLSNEKLSKLIISNLMYLSKTKYITFEELYDSLKI